MKCTVAMRNITDEQLAAFLEGRLPEKGREEVLAAMDVDTLEVLGVSRRALRQGQLPSWKDADGADVFRVVNRPLAMAGFLGDPDADDGFTDDESGDGYADR